VSAATLELLRDIFRANKHESFVILILDHRGEVTTWREVARGSRSHVQVSLPELFSAAMLCGAKALVVAHNHPGADPTPSREDIILTERLATAGELVGCPILDHIIIADSCHYSFRRSC
jgi:DNA repair protein RadC